MQKTRSHQTMSLTPKLAGQMSMTDFLAGIDSQRSTQVASSKCGNVSCLVRGESGPTRTHMEPF